MRKMPIVMWSLFLATMLHVDWHLARPLHHRLSLALPYHWVITATAFALAGWWIGRHVTAGKWRFALIVFVVAVMLAQGLEPVLEVAFYDGRVGYPADPGRWAAFFRAMTATTPAYFGCVWLCGRQPALLRPRYAAKH